MPAAGRDLVIFRVGPRSRRPALGRLCPSCRRAPKRNHSTSCRFALAPALLNRCCGNAAPDTDHEETGKTMDENEHPKGALVFMLLYLVTLAALWLNAYLRLWRG